MAPHNHDQSAQGQTLTNQTALTWGDCALCDQNDLSLPKFCRFCLRQGCFIVKLWFHFGGQHDKNVCTCELWGFCCCSFWVHWEHIFMTDLILHVCNPMGSQSNHTSHWLGACNCWNKTSAWRSHGASTMQFCLFGLESSRFQHFSSLASAFCLHQLASCWEFFPQLQKCFDPSPKFVLLFPHADADEQPVAKLVSIAHVGSSSQSTGGMCCTKRFWRHPKRWLRVQMVDNLGAISLGRGRGIPRNSSLPRGT